MKNNLFIALFIVSNIFYAQRSGGRNGGLLNQNQQNRGNTQPQKFNASNLAGIFYYDFKEVAKKVKIKDKDLKNSALKIFKDYNSEVKNIAFLNSEKLTDLEAGVASIGNQARTNPELRKKVRKLIQETVTTIRDSIGKSEKKLNDNLEEILNEKQLKKWVKYQKAQKDKLKPKRPQRNNNGGQQQQRGNRQRGGF